MIGVLYIYYLQETTVSILKIQEFQNHQYYYLLYLQRHCVYKEYLVYLEILILML
nr:MAG TPA: hypothetical protein [Caudoviricetes sp.]